MRRKHHIEVEWLIREYIRRGRSAADIAREVGCCTAVILRRLRENNVTIKSMSEVKKGIRVSPETEFKSGMVPWNKGKKNPYSDKVIRSMSEAKKGKHISPSTEFKKGHTTWNKGLTAEHDERLRWSEESKQLKRGKPNPGVSRALKGRKLTPEHRRNSLRRRIPSSLEKKFQKVIEKHELPYKYVGDGSFILAGYNPDFINTNGQKIAIEVYTKFYKQLDGRNIEEWREERTKRFSHYGWTVIYFDETQVREDIILDILGGV